MKKIKNIFGRTYIGQNMLDSMMFGRIFFKKKKHFYICGVRYFYSEIIETRFEYYLLTIWGLTQAKRSDGILATRSIFPGMRHLNLKAALLSLKTFSFFYFRRFSRVYCIRHMCFPDISR